MGRPRKDMTESASYLLELERRLTDPDQRRRIGALRLMREEQGRPMREIAAEVGASERQVRRWWRAYRDGGVERVLERGKPGGGRPPRIDTPTIAALQRRVATGELATLKEAADWLEQNAGVRYSASGIHTLLRREMGLTSAQNVLRKAGSVTAGAPRPVALSSEACLRFLTTLPVTGDTVEWINRFRTGLRDLLGDVDRISLNINRQASLQDPQSPEVVFSVTQYADAVGEQQGVDVSTQDRSAPFSDRLLAGVREQGFPLDDYHEPLAYNYFFSGIAYVGTMFLWRERNRPPIASATIELIERLEPFVVYAITSHVAWCQYSRPSDRGFQIALRNMVQATGLTPQEQRVAVLQLLGRSHKEIAQMLTIAVPTVKKHVNSIYRKTGTRSHSELFARYFTSRIGSGLDGQ